MSKEKLVFYTIGEDFTNLLRTFLREGLYWKVNEILRDGGLNENHVRSFFQGGLKFEGDSRDEGGMSVVKDTPMDSKEFTEFIYYGMSTCTPSGFDVIDLFSDDFQNMDEEYSKNFRVLFSLYPKDMVYAMITPHIILRNGFEILNAIHPRFNGVVLSDGRIVSCGFQQHDLLQPLLKRLKLVSSGRWMDCDNSIHISEGQLSGTLSHAIRNYSWTDKDYKKNITPEIIETLSKNHSNLSFYGYGNETMTKVLMDYFESVTSKGGKYGKLIFLNKVYPEIKTPLFSLSPIDGVDNCIRTSPKYSIPGLLNSKFNITKNSVKEIESDWELCKDIIKGNVLNVFYQEYLEGSNGVAHFRLRNKDFNYDLSKNRGDIVEGRVGGLELDPENKELLRKWMFQISKDLKKDIQIEFVISNNLLYIVQLRTLGRNPYSSRPYQINLEKVLYSGIGFNKLKSEVLKLEEVLVIDSDCESKELVGKKGLIVRNNVEFSHALALSISLGIPSIYSVGDVNLPEEFIIDSQSEDAYILKL